MPWNFFLCLCHYQHRYENITVSSLPVVRTICGWKANISGHFPAGLPRPAQIVFCLPVIHPGFHHELILNCATVFYPGLHLGYNLLNPALLQAHNFSIGNSFLSDASAANVLPGFADWAVWFWIIVAYCFSLSGWFTILSCNRTSADNIFITASGVLNSWVKLLTKSFWISVQNFWR